MTWSDFYLFCFVAGFLFSLVSLVVGHFDLSFGHGGHAHFGGHAHPGGHAPAGGHGHAGAHAHGFGSMFSPATMAAFLAWFGGTGFLITRFYGLWFVFTLKLALLAGLAGGYTVYWFLTRVLMRGGREELDPADFDMIGVLGTVSSSIRESGIGEILFSQQGIRRASAARSESGTAIPNGTEVVVTRYENGVAFVRRWDEFAA